MEFSRIDHDTIRCVLTEQDMKERGIELEDFFKNKEKVQRFFEEIVEEAKKEVSYESKSGVLAVQVMPLPENGLAILFSENQDPEFNGFLKNMKDMAGDFTADLMSDEKKADKVSHNNKVKLNIYSFTSLSHVEQFAGALSLQKPVKSQLFKNNMDSCYYLVVEKGRISMKLFSAICEKAVEFSEFVSDDPRMVAYYQEHFTMLIEKNAITKIAAYL